MTTSGSSIVKKVVLVHREKQVPSISAADLDYSLRHVKDDATYIVQLDNDDGVSYLRFATCIFSRLVELKRPCLDVVTSRELSDSENSSSRFGLTSNTEMNENQECKERWLSVAADGYKFGDGNPDFYNKYDVVAVGGTFDRLHAGHRLLLTAACWAARLKLLIGVTGESMLRNKKHKELIASFEERSRAALSYVQQVKPSLQFVEVVELHTPEGPTTSDPEINALVVSSETARGAMTINETRVAAALKPLKIIVVDVLDTAEQKLSSSILRKAEFDKGRRAQSGA